MDGLEHRRSYGEEATTCVLIVTAIALMIGSLSR